MIHCDHVSILHRYKDMAPERWWNYDLDLLESRDVMGHVTIRLAEGHFLWVVHCDHTPIFHSYGDIEPQTLDAHTDAQVILYSVQWYALHWTDKNFISVITCESVITQTYFIGHLGAWSRDLPVRGKRKWRRRAWVEMLAWRHWWARYWR